MHFATRTSATRIFFFYQHVGRYSRPSARHNSASTHLDRASHSQLKLRTVTVASRVGASATIFPSMDLPAQPAQTQIYPEGSRSGDTQVHQEGSRFGATHVTGGSVFQGNFVGLTISKRLLPTAILL